MWIKLSGASKNLLDKTGEFSEKETIKYSSYGRLVLIPAILGGFAGTYAFSTILDNNYLSIAFGILWFSIVLVIDMAMSATIYKSKRDKPIGFWIAVIFRIVFAICVGLVVSHPLVLSVFEPSIEKNIQQRDDFNKAQEIFGAKTKLDTAKNYYLTRIDSIRGQNQCLTNLIQFETSKDNTYARNFLDDKNILCGVSSGKGGGCSSECIERKKLIKANEKQINLYTKEMEKSTSSEQGILDDAEDHKNRPVITDYLERTEALDLLMNGDGKHFKMHPHVSIAAKLLIFFFVIMDILIVVFKASTPMGAYEHTMDLYLDRHIGLLEAKKEVDIRYAKESEDIMRKIHLKAILIGEARELYSKIVANLDDDFDGFEAIRRKWLKSASIFDLKRKKQIKQELYELEKLYALSRTKTIHTLAVELSNMKAQENVETKENSNN